MASDVDCRSAGLGDIALGRCVAQEVPFKPRGLSWSADALERRAWEAARAGSASRMFTDSEVDGMLAVELSDTCPLAWGFAFIQVAVGSDDSEAGPGPAAHDQTGWEALRGVAGGVGNTRNAPGYDGWTRIG